MKSNLLNNVSRSFHQVGFQLKKHSPTILVGAGIVGVVASTIMACKATTKVNDILEETKDTVEKIHKCAEDEELIASGEYTVEDSKKDLAITYTQTGLKLVKLYAPAVALGTVSIVGILSSHRIMTKRNAALGAAYAAVDAGFKSYRKNVKERFGDRVDYELKHNIKAEKIEVVSVDENGKETKETQTIDVMQDEFPHSPYARFFDETSTMWQRDAEYNLMFLRQQEAYANQKLRSEGFLFLNDVYEALGLKKTKEGQIVGWIYNEKNPAGDNFVDFGIYDIHRRGFEERRYFVNGYEKSILLDFNVDGNIWELMP